MVSLTGVTETTSESEVFHQPSNDLNGTQETSSDSSLDDDDEKKVAEAVVDHRHPPKDVAVAVDHDCEDEKVEIEKSDEVKKYEYERQRQCGRRFNGPAWKRASLSIQWEIGQTVSKRHVEKTYFHKKKSKGGVARRQRREKWQR